MNEKLNFLKNPWFFVLVFIFIGILFFFFYKNNSEKSPIQQTTDQGLLDQTQEEGVYYLGILPLRNPSTMLERFAGVEKYLQEQTGLDIKLKFYPTDGAVGGYTAVVKDIVNGNINFAFLAPVTIAQAHVNDEAIIPFACAQKEGSPTYYGHIVVRGDSPYQAIEDLEGKAVCGTSSSSTSGNLMPTAMLQELGIDKETYFEPFEFLGSHDKAAEAVLAKTMEAAFINEATFDKYKDQGLRSIWKHDAVPEFPFCVNTDTVSEKELKKVKNALLTMHETNLEDIQAVETKYDKWVEITWKDYISIKNAVDNVHGEAFYDLDTWTGKE